MKIKKIKEKILEFSKDMFESSIRIVGMKRDENEGWIVTLETLEEGKYARQFARDEIIGIYEVKLDQNLEIISWQRSNFRERGTFEKTN